MKQKKEILVVNDSMLIFERLIGILKSVENIDSIKHAGTYEEATTLMGECQPDIVFLDINLPGKSGIELLNKIKNEGYEGTVIMFTYYKNLCTKMGADYLVDKSKDLELIPEIVSSLDKKAS